MSQVYTEFKTHTILEKDETFIKTLEEKIPGATVHHTDNMTFDFTKLEKQKKSPTFVDFDAYTQPFPLIKKYLKSTTNAPKFLALTDGTFLNMNRNTTNMETRYKWLKDHKYPIPSFKREPSYSQLIQNSAMIYLQDILEQFGKKTEMLAMHNHHDTVYLSVRISS